MPRTIPATKIYVTKAITETKKMSASQNQIQQFHMDDIISNKHNGELQRTDPSTKVSE